MRNHSRRVRQLGLSAATSVVLAVAGCQDDPLFVPTADKPADMAGEGGEASGGQGGDRGTLPYGYGAQAAASYGAWSGVELPPVPIAGITGGGTGGGTGSGGSAGGQVVNKNCGDGKTDLGEECDDGNKLSGDGCSSNCISRCETCEQNHCPLYDQDGEPWYDRCYSMEGKAEGGPATGVPRAELCAALVDCVRRTGCARPEGAFGLEFEGCYCQFEGSRDVCNQADFVRGPCYKEFQEASEQEGIGSTMWGLLSAATRAIGPGYQLVSKCDAWACRDECLPDAVQQGEVTTLSDDLPVSYSAESPMANLVADAQRAAGQTDFALVLPNAISYGLTKAATPDRVADAEGRLLWSELMNALYGYYRGENTVAGYALRTMTLTGQLVYDALNQGTTLLAVSGLTYTYDLRLPVGSRVTEVRSNGTPLDRSASYTVTADIALTRAAFNSATGVTTIATSPLAALVQHIESLPSPVVSPSTDRIVVLQ